MQKGNPEEQKSFGFPFLHFPKVVSHSFLWYDKRKGLFSKREKSAVSVWIKTKNRNKNWRKKHEKYKGLC